MIWAIATSFNITKPVHIDDSEYLQIARYIITNPLHPMSGTKSVYPSLTTSISQTNHPLLIPYYLALTILIFGQSELALHLSMSVFTFLAIFSTYLIAKKFVPKYSDITTIIIILSPAFLPSQNLMTDVPLVFLWLSFFAVLFCLEQKLSFRYFLAGIIIALAVLVKYTSLILIPIIILDITLSKNWLRLWSVIIPFIVLLGWSIFNYFDYGGIHLLGSIKAPFFVSDLGKKLLLWFITLGSVAPFSIMFIPFMLTRKKRAIILLGGVAITTVFAKIIWQYPKEPVINSFLRELFFANGIFITLLTVYLSVKQFIKINFRKITQSDQNDIILFLWFLLPSLFIIQFVPFLAVRHILLIMPAIILILARNLFDEVSGKWIYAGLFATVIFGFILGLADWQQANTYWVYAPKIYKQIRQLQKDSGKTSTIWFAGFWDWQWYATKAGMKQYNPEKSELSSGDYLVVPAIERQPVKAKHIKLLKKLYEDSFSPTIYTYFRTLTNYPFSPAGFYAILDPRQLPWTISNRPIETFDVFQVIPPGKQ